MLGKTLNPSFRCAAYGLKIAGLEAWSARLWVEKA